MHIKSLRYFLTLASTSSFLATARHFHVPASSVSRHIASLEKDLGKQLFYRNTRAVRLTEEGARFELQVREAIEILDGAIGNLEDSDGGIEGVIRINAPEAFGRLHLAKIVDNLQCTYPKLVVELVLTDTFIDPVHEGADITIRIGAPVDSTLIGKVVSANRYVIAASPAYLARQGEPASLEDLGNHNCLLYKGLYGTQRWYFRQRGAQVYVAVMWRERFGVIMPRFSFLQRLPVGA